MDKNSLKVPSYEEFSRGLNLTDPVDQELYLLSLNLNFKKAIKALKDKFKIQKPPFDIPKNKDYYPLGVHDLARYAEVKDEKELEKALFSIVDKTRFKNTRYFLSLVNGLIYYILYVELRILKRPNQDTPLPPVKTEIKRHSKLGVKEVIRMTLDLFVDTAEDEAHKAIHEHWKHVKAMQNNILNGKRFIRPATKDAVIRDSYIYFLNNLGFSPAEIEEFIPKTFKLTLKEINDRLVKIKSKVDSSFST